MAQQGGWGALGEVLGGGIDRAGAYEEGRLHTAQTETAIGRAREHQLKNIAMAQQQKKLQEFEARMAQEGIDPRALAGTAAAAGLGDFNQVTQGALNLQEYGNRRVLSSPGETAQDRFLAGQGVQGKALSPYETVGPAGYVDLTAQDPSVLTTPLGESMIDENTASIAASEALAGLRNVQAGDPDYRTASGGGDGTGGPGKPPSGYVANPAFDPSKPIGEGNYAFTDARAPVMGARESVFLTRVIGGANNARTTIANLKQLPATASAGLIGIGSKPGQSVTQGMVDSLRNQLSSQDVQSYNTMIAGLDANLAQIEGHGLATSDSFRGQYDRLALREGDTNFTRLRKLAEMAQTIESGLEPYLSNPRIPPQQKQYMADLVADVRRTIPFTHGDVARLEVAPNVQTLQGLIEQYKLDQPKPAVPPVGTSPTIGTPGADGWIDKGNGIRVRKKVQ